MAPDETHPAGSPGGTAPGPDHEQAFDRDPRFATARLKERLYATITMVAVVIGLAGSEHIGAAGAAATV
ncbi:hypothetical protein [Streptomyces avidinii]